MNVSLLFKEQQQPHVHGPPRGAAAPTDPDSFVIVVTVTTFYGDRCHDDH
jgi:hypothetical protein